MALFYSPSRNTFFEDSVHSVMPDDVRPISKAMHSAIMNATCEGMVLAADEDGNPAAVPPPPPDRAELFRQLRTQRDKLLTASDFTQVSDAPLSDEMREQWRLYRQALRDLPETVTDPAAAEWPVAPA